MAEETKDNAPPFAGESGDQAPARDDLQQERIRGVFSTQVVQKVGTGTTTRRTIQKMYWFVEQDKEELLEIQPLNKHYIPSGPKRKVTKEELLEKFSPEPEFYMSTVFPKMRELNMTIVKGERHREKGENFSAELEFDQALSVDEENVRANFGLGLTYLDRGEANKANDIFERLVKLDAAFEGEHKHLFNEFGINLRRNKMLEQSLEYYKRAEELADTDENLMYNIARTLFDKKQMDEALTYLKKALTIRPDFNEAKRFTAFLVDRGFVDKEAAGDAYNGEGPTFDDAGTEDIDGEAPKKPSGKPIKVDF